MRVGKKHRADREAGQVSLFGPISGAESQKVKDQLPDVPEWDEKTRLVGEKSTLGFYVSGHPLESYRELLEQYGTHTTATLRDLDSGTEVAVGGVINDLRSKKSRKGDMWASFQLEDLDGQLEVLVFPKCYAAHEADLEQDRAAMITARVEIEEDRVRLIADKVCPIEQLHERHVEAVHVRLDAIDLDEQLVEKLMNAVESHRGKSRLYFEVARPGVYRLVAMAESAMGVAASKDLTHELESLIGPQRVQFRAKGMLET